MKYLKENNVDMSTVHLRADGYVLFTQTEAELFQQLQDFQKEHKRSEPNYMSEYNRLEDAFDSVFYSITPEVQKQHELLERKWDLGWQISNIRSSHPNRDNDKLPEVQKLKEEQRQLGA